LLSAIEDNLTEPQRQQVRDQRRRVAKHEKAIAGTNVKAKQETAKPAIAVKEELAIVGVPLTPNRKSGRHDPGKVPRRLRSLNRGIEGLHNRLVSLEADKLVEIEKVLTKDQLKQLREIRQSAPPPRRVKQPARAMRRGLGDVSCSCGGADGTAPRRGERSFFHFHPKHAKGIHREAHFSLTGTRRLLLSWRPCWRHWRPRRVVVSMPKEWLLQLVRLRPLWRIQPSLRRPISSQQQHVPEPRRDVRP